MRHIMLLLAVAAVMAAMVVVPGVAGAQEEPTNVSHKCKDGSLFGASHGGCVAFWETPFDNRNTTANGATSCQDPDYRAFIGSISNGPVTTPGQCMKARQELFG